MALLPFCSGVLPYSSMSYLCPFLRGVSALPRIQCDIGDSSFWQSPVSLLRVNSGSLSRISSNFFAADPNHDKISYQRLG